MEIKKKYSLKHERLIDFNSVLNPFSVLKINPSICNHNDNIFCSYRSDHLYGYNAKNYLTQLDWNFTPIWHKKLRLETGNTAFEDVRLFSFGESLHALYTYLPKSDNGWDWRYRIGMGVVDVASGVITHNQSFDKESTRFHEKNWVPYSNNGNLYIITDFDPFLRILSISGSIGAYNVQEHFTSVVRTPPWFFGEVRGGSPLLQNPKCDSGDYFGFVHCCTNFNDGGKIYLYGVVRFNHAALSFEYYRSPIGMSNGDKSNIYYQTLWQMGTNNRDISCVFPMGIMEYDEGVLMSFGQDDCISKVEYYTWEYLQNLF